jgi:hypothetical protein
LKKFSELLVWPPTPPTVTVTAWFPPADDEFVGVKVAVILVEELTLTLVTVMFDPALTVAPEANPVPVIVTPIAVPTKPWAGLTLVIVGFTLVGAVAWGWEIGQVGEYSRWP